MQCNIKIHIHFSLFTNPSKLYHHLNNLNYFLCKYLQQRNSNGTRIFIINLNLNYHLKALGASIADRNNLFYLNGFFPRKHKSVNCSNLNHSNIIIPFRFKMSSKPSSITMGAFDSIQISTDDSKVEVHPSFITIHFNSWHNSLTCTRIREVCVCVCFVISISNMIFAIYIERNGQINFHYVLHYMYIVCPNPNHSLCIQGTLYPVLNSNKKKNLNENFSRIFIRFYRIRDTTTKP